MAAALSRHGFRFTADERRVLLATFHRYAGRTPPRAECDDLAHRFSQARRQEQLPEKDDISGLPLFAMNEAEAWLMNDDTVEMLFSDPWLYPPAAAADEQPKGSEQHSDRRCTAHSTAGVMPAVCGKQVKTWFENKRCSDKRSVLGIKARRPKN